MKAWICAHYSTILPLILELSQNEVSFVLNQHPVKVLPFVIPTTRGESFRVQLDDEQHFYDTFHKHRELQIMFIEESEGTVICGDYVGNFYPGDLFVIGPDVPHVFRNGAEYYNGQADSRARAISLYFDRASFGSSFFNIPEIERINDFLNESVRGIKYGSVTRKAIEGHLYDIGKADGVNRFIELMKILQLLSEAKDKEFLMAQGEGSSFDEKEGSRMNKIYQFTMQESYRSISLQEVADLASMTPNAFCRYFKKRTRKTYVNFLNEVRISNACKMLKNKELTIAQVCYQSGFNNLSHFNRCFKRIKGVSPKVYQGKLWAS